MIKSLPAPPLVEIREPLPDIGEPALTISAPITITAEDVLDRARALLPSLSESDIPAAAQRLADLLNNLPAELDVEMTADETEHIDPPSFDPMAEDDITLYRLPKIDTSSTRDPVYIDSQIRPNLRYITGREHNGKDEPIYNVSDAAQYTERFRITHTGIPVMIGTETFDWHETWHGVPPTVVRPIWGLSIAGADEPTSRARMRGTSSRSLQGRTGPSVPCHERSCPRHPAPHGHRHGPSVAETLTHRMATSQRSSATWCPSRYSILQPAESLPGTETRDETGKLIGRTGPISRTHRYSVTFKFDAETMRWVTSSSEPAGNKRGTKVRDRTVTVDNLLTVDIDALCSDPSFQSGRWTDGALTIRVTRKDDPNTSAHRFAVTMSKKIDDEVKRATRRGTLGSLSRSLKRYATK